MEGPLSTDVVMGIVMNHLKVRDLLSCRKVSKFWNKIASSALRKRSTMIKKISSVEELMELGECMTEGSDFPFAGLKLFCKPCSLSSAGTIEFFRNHGASFTRLCLGPWTKTRLEDLAQLMNRLPRLSTLEVSSCWEYAPNSGSLKHAAGQEDGSIFNLPSLRTLRICSVINQDFLRQVCTAASPSLQIECLNPTHGLLIALKRVGKLQAVSVMNTYKGKHYALRAEISKLLSVESPTLTKLGLSIDGFLSLHGLSKILISSQQTLKELNLIGLYPSEFLSDCPVLPKLTTLSLCLDNVDESYEYVLEGNQGSKFPGLLKLELYAMRNSYANFSDALFIVPSLTTIELDGLFDKNDIKDLARSFPNVIEIRLNNQYYDDDPNEIWNLGAFKFLEKLKIWGYHVRRPSEDCMNMDRFLTGMCNAICKNLRKHAQQNLIDSPFNEILRKSPSILQLKNLKELVVCVHLDFYDDDDGSELPEEPPFCSMVSVWYALSMMPNLQSRFLYEPPSLSEDYGEEKRDKTVAALKAAFKNVQQCVELEPFFY